MSKENLEQFMSKVADSEELQAKIGEEIDAEALIALGAECGCEFTAEELSEAAELTDDELDSIAGGFFSDDDAQYMRLRSIRAASFAWGSKGTFTLTNDQVPAVTDGDTGSSGC